MRGSDEQQGWMFSYISPEKRVPQDHPLRSIRTMVDEALRGMSQQFAKLYSRTGRPSVAPEKLIRALLLQALYSIRSERLLIEQLEYNLLFRWFVGLSMDDPVWDATVFSKNRERLLQGDISKELLEEVLEQARQRQLLSDEHFTVDGTLIEAWAGQKSFKKKAAETEGTKPPDDPGNPTVVFRGEKRTNDTHKSTTDPEARLYKKATGQEAKLCFLGHLLMENRNGLVVDAGVTQATGTAERETALEMIGEQAGTGGCTLGADKAYDTKAFVAGLRELSVTPHVAQNTRPGRPGAIDGRTTRHHGYQLSQVKRKRIEEVFGWLKTVALMRKTKFRGTRRVDWTFTFAATAYNLVRMRNLPVPA